MSDLSPAPESPAKSPAPPADTTPAPDTAAAPEPTSTGASTRHSPRNTRTKPDSASGSTVIDPQLADLPAPPHPNPQPAAVNGSSTPTMTITESIASAPNPRPADFSMLPITTQDVDLSSIEETSNPKGSPSIELLRAVAPPNAAQVETKWPAPPPNASVNLFIGRALFADGNDNWPLKPNDIVNWIRKHYPSEWDGDEGRCSAHRVRTYLARKGADMYYEKLSQGCITGWRIRQNHIWRFENGGFLGRGMKQEEAIAQAAKESEAIATAAHKAAAAEALAAGHPGVKVSMSHAGRADGHPAAKKQKMSATKGAGQARRKNNSKAKAEAELAAARAAAASTLSSSDIGVAAGHQTDSSNFYQPVPITHPSFTHTFDTNEAGPSTDPSTLHDTTLTVPESHNEIDPTLMSAASGDAQVDLDIMQRAMEAAAGHHQQIDDLEMGMQLPIEMQIHGSGEHGDDGSNDYYGHSAANSVGPTGLEGTVNGENGENGDHPYTPHGEFETGDYGFLS